MANPKATDDEQRRAAVMRMRVVDDTFFERFIDDPGACEELIQTVLDNPRIRIKPETLVPQKSVHFVANHSVRVDAYVEDENDIVYNIEIQRFDNCNHVKRVRYSASAITVSGLYPGDTYEDVRNVIVIYISEFDIFGLGRIIYHAYTTIEETNTIVNDGLKMIYVNASSVDESMLSRLMQLYKQADFEDAAFPKNSARMHQLKHDEREVMYMCSIVKELQDKAAAKAAIGAMVETARELGATDDKIISMVMSKFDITKTEAEEKLCEYNLSNQR